MGGHHVCDIVSVPNLTLRTFRDLAAYSWMRNGAPDFGGHLRYLVAWSEKSEAAVGKHIARAEPRRADDWNSGDHRLEQCKRHSLEPGRHQNEVYARKQGRDVVAI